MKTRIVIVSVLAIATIALAACGGGAQTSGSSAPAASKGDVTKGKTAFMGTCIACHGPEAKGMPGLGKDLTTSGFVKDQTDDQLVAFLKKGRTASDPLNTTKVDMPPKGGNPALTDKDLQDIVAFLRSVNK